MKLKIHQDKNKTKRYEYTSVPGPHANMRRLARQKGITPIDTRALDQLLKARLDEAK